MLKVISKPYFLLSILVAFALLLRVYRISDFPVSLNWDEVSHGYNAYSILKSGADEWGFKFPAIFRAYGDYKLPVYIYISALSVGVFGLNEFAVRLPSVIAGTVAVLLTYYLTKELLKNQKSKKLTTRVGLMAAFLLTIEPWSLFLSRPAFEANLALVLFLGGFLLLLKSYSKVKYLPFSVILLGLSVWTYNSYRIFTPLMLLFALILYGKSYFNILKNHITSLISAILFTVIFFVPMFFQLLGTGNARFDKISIIDDGLVGRVIETREKLKYSPNMERLMINKYTFASIEFAKNWLSTFNPKFLFLTGGSNYQFNVPGHGILYVFGAPFLFVGLLVIFRNFVKYRFLIFWIIISPVAASLTREAPHVLRNITLLPIPMVLTSIGVTTFIEWSIKILNLDNKSERHVNFSILFKNGLYVAFVFVYIILLVSFANKYMRYYPQKYSWSWQYGYKQVSEYIKANYNNYDKIILTKKYGEPHEFLLFYLKYDPIKYLTDNNLIRYSQSGWYWVDSFDKFVFVNEWDIPTEEWQSFVTEKGAIVDCTAQKCLLVSDPDSFPKTWKILKQIEFLDGKTAFSVFTNN